MIIRNLILLFVVFALSACDKPDETAKKENNADNNGSSAMVENTVAENTDTQAKPNTKKPSESAYRTVEWENLIPKEDLETLLNPPKYITDVVDGSLDDQIAEALRMGEMPPTLAQQDDPYQQALVSTNIIPEFNNQKIRIPGFIVPIDFAEDQAVKTFFFVPFFGACIHVPPPPPNQIIYGTYDKGVKLGELYDPYWIEGTLKTEIVENDIAKSAYVMSVDSVQPYEEE